MKSIHHIAIKYLTYLVLNKRKLDNKQEHVQLPTQGSCDKTIILHKIEPTYCKDMQETLALK